MMGEAAVVAMRNLRQNLSISTMRSLLDIGQKNHHNGYKERYEKLFQVICTFCFTPVFPKGEHYEN